jgi:excisionase family DNA binding protein
VSDQETNDRKVLLTPTEAAKVLGMSRTNLYRLLGSGEVESLKIGGLRRIPVAALDEYVEALRAAHRSCGDNPLPLTSTVP